MMKKYKSSEKRVDLYDIGDGMTLMNIVNRNAEGKIDSIYMYIGYTDEDSFLRVGIAEDLAAPGSLFNYASFMRGVHERMLLYKAIFKSNLTGGQFRVMQN